MSRFPKNDIISLIGAAPRYDLAESVGPNLSLGELLEASDWEALRNASLGYGTAEGEAALRKAIGGQHDVGPDNVVVTLGGAHALFLIALVLCGQGDEAITTAPVFPHTRTGLEATGARVKVLRLTFDEGYQPDLTNFIALLSPATKLVSLASPQNPSGVTIEQYRLEEMAAAMARICPNAYLLVDETYREATYGTQPPTRSVISSLGPRTVSVASLSKCHGAPGLRIGWAITRAPEMREQLVLGKFNTAISCSPIDEALALTVLRRRDLVLSERSLRLAHAVHLTDDWVSANSRHVQWVRPNAGAICCVRLRPAVFDDAAVSGFYQAAARAGVRVANGAWFGDEARVFRLGFGLLDGADLQIALRILSTVLREIVPHLG
ncbi:MAG TPA: pyridoxal phosphate-dependent aminotransferase [Burkholderiales bacterium]|nr:pyridoxal phosphate-dependent aminotransferase [Burkholderiales bacterium]